MAEKKHVAVVDVSSAVRHFSAGISFLHEHHWADQYELSLVLFECLALAHYAEGNHEQVIAQVNHVLSHAKSFEDKFKSYCTFINFIATGSVERVAKKLCELLRPPGETDDPSLISQKVAAQEFLSARERLLRDPDQPPP